MSLPTRKHANWIKAYMQYSRHSEAPDALHFWTAISVIAGCLRRRVWIEESIFQIVPNFYIIFVAPPGIATKSTTVDLGMRLLRRVDGVMFGPNSMTWQGLSVALEEARTAIEYEDRILQMSCLTIPVTELGTFLKTHDGELLDVLTDIWDGRQTEWRHRTKTAREGQSTTTLIVNPWMNIIGCTTPAWMRRNFPSYIIEGGLTSRCVFIFANHKRKLVALPHKHINHEIFLSEGDALVADLEIISQIIGPYELTLDAERLCEEWYEKHWGEAAQGGIGDRYSGYMSRKQGHILKTAIILSAAQRNERIITLEDVQMATRAITALESDMNKMFETIGSADAARQTTDILTQIRLSGSISYRELWRMFMPFVDQRNFDMAIRALTTAGHVITTENERKELFLMPFNSGGDISRRVLH